MPPDSDKGSRDGFQGQLEKRKQVTSFPSAQYHLGFEISLIQLPII